MTKFHLSLNVSNLDYSVGFYRLLFGCDPAKWFPDYAKFELSEPPIVLALEPTTAATTGGTLNHLGIRVEKAESIDEFERRLSQVGVSVQRLTDIECCYSRQNKIVFRDPDQNLIEVYTLEGDSERLAPPVTTEVPKAETGTQKAFEHLVGMPFPSTIESGISEARFRGTFNREEEFAAIDDILAKAKNALVPGGQLLLHLLVADVPLEGKLPSLPPPADQVKCVPTQRQIVEAVEKAGFGYLEVKRLSHSAVMQIGKTELRELLLHAKTLPSPKVVSQRDVVYMGPFKKLEDDHGRVFARGQRVAVEDAELQWLEEQGWLSQFTVLNESASTCQAGN